MHRRQRERQYEAAVSQAQAARGLDLARPAVQQNAQYSALGQGPALARHAGLLADSARRGPGQAVGLARSLQRSLGNRYVGAVLAAARGEARSTGARATPRPRISLRSFGAAPYERGAPDKSRPGSANEVQDQSASLTSLTKHARGVEISVEATEVYSSAEYPDGFKWTQTIDTNVPLGGSTSPYVDPRPNDDTKPFYYTDAEHAASLTTFYDKPSRNTPSTGTTHWNAVLCLNGVNESTKTVVAYDALTYGFSLDSAGTVTINGPASVGTAGHRSILASEFSGWTFS